MQSQRLHIHGKSKFYHAYGITVIEMVYSVDTIATTQDNTKDLPTAEKKTCRTHTPQTTVTQKPTLPHKSAS